MFTRSLRTFVMSAALASLAAIAADTALAAKSVQKASAKLHVMPKGDHLNAALRQNRTRNIPLHYAISHKRLKAIKALAGSSDSGQRALEATGLGKSGAPVISQTCTTNSADVFTPSDINGAVSDTHIVSVTNDAIGIYRKADCSTLSRESLEDFVDAVWNIPPTQEVFDPRVIFDASIGRFVATAETFDDLNTDQYQYIAISTDGTASAWYIYQIKLSEEATDTNFCKFAPSSFWDYPMLGSSASRWFITANDFPSGQPDEGGERAGRAVPSQLAAILSIDKTPTLTGDPVTFSCFNNLLVNLAPPIVGDAATTSYFLSTGGVGAGSAITVYTVDSSSAEAKDDTAMLESPVGVPAWSAAPNAPQPNKQKLDTLDGRFQAPSIQIGKHIWNVHTVNVNNRARWRLYRFTVQANTTLTRKVITSPSTVADGKDNLFNPSVATRSDQPDMPAYVTFTRTIPNSTTTRGYASMMIAKGPNSSGTGWASKLISRSLDQYVETGFRAGSTKCNDDPDIGTCRWGDYSSTQIDPVDGNFVWGFNQLIIGNTSKNWTTKGAKVK